MNMYYFVLYITISALTVYLCEMFFNIFFTKLSPNWVAAIISITSAGLTAAASIFFPDNTILKLIANATAIIFISFIYKMKWYYHIVIPLALYAMLSICEYATISFITILFSFDRHFCEFAEYNTIILFFSRFVFYLLLSIIRVAKQKFAKSKFHHGLLVLVVVPALCISIILMQYKYVSYTEEVSFALSSMSLLCYAAIIVYNILVFDWINYIKAGVERDTKLAAANELIAVQAEQYRETIEHHKHVYQLRHDQKNLILGVLSELENKNYEAIKNILTEELECTSAVSTLNLSNGIISSIIEHKGKIAKEKSINIEASLSGIDNIKISPIDLSIVLGNALDNAIEATEKICDYTRKTINVSVKTIKGTVLISIVNPTAENVDTSNLSSSKEDPENHGFGILSIRNIVEKYGGGVYFSCENLLFKTTIMLRNNDRSTLLDAPFSTLEVN